MEGDKEKAEDLVGISVIICCYNSARRIAETLRHLALQSVTMPWEVIVVDNNSSDATATVAKREWQKYNLPTPLIVVAETKPGLSHARTAGTKSSRYQFLVFCDDDNWLCPGYLEIGSALLNKNPAVAVVGGKGEPVCEGIVPEWFEQYQTYYATGAQATQSGKINSQKGFVYGAGSFYRKSILEKLTADGFSTFLEDRKGNSLSAGGDVELCNAIMLSGYEIWYEERMIFKHFIPKERLTWDYIIKLHKGYIEAMPVLKAYQYARRRERFVSLWIRDVVVSSVLYLKNIFRSHDDQRYSAKLKRGYKRRTLITLVTTVMVIYHFYRKITNSKWYGK